MVDRTQLLADERPLIVPSQSSTELRGVILFPQSYAIGMSSLATHALYEGLNASGEIAWERAFIAPSVDGTRLAPLCSLETGSPLRDFDVVAITSSWELDWPALPTALQDGGIAPLRHERREGPLLIVGGPAVSAAPLPLSALYDAAFIGEIEPALPVLRRALLASSREAVLEQLAAEPGFYVPVLHPEPAPKTLKRRCAVDLNSFDTTSVILSPHAEFANRFLLEIGRGCGRSCAFCLARRLYRPLRWRSLDRIMETVRRGLRYTNDLGMIAAAVSDYPHLDDLCAELETVSPDLRLSTSSIRLETATSRFLALLARGGQSTVTFAPEAATERLRQAIGKKLAEDEIFAAVERAATVGLTRVRLYFMVGLPTEQPEDLAAFGDLLKRLTQQFRQMHFRCNIGAFSPRPHTPFEREPLPALRDLRNRLGKVVRMLRGLPRVEAAGESARWAAMQAAFSRSDQRLGLALVKHPHHDFASLVKAMEAEGLCFERLTAAATDDCLPWKVVDPNCAD